MGCELVERLVALTVKEVGVVCPGCVPPSQLPVCDWFVTVGNTLVIVRASPAAGLELVRLTVHKGPLPQEVAVGLPDVLVVMNCNGPGGLTTRTGFVLAHN